MITSIWMLIWSGLKFDMAEMTKFSLTQGEIGWSWSECRDTSKVLQLLSGHCENKACSVQNTPVCSTSSSTYSHKQHCIPVIHYTCAVSRHLRSEITTYLKFLIPVPTSSWLNNLLGSIVVESHVTLSSWYPDSCLRIIIRRTVNRSHNYSCRQLRF